MVYERRRARRKAGSLRLGGRNDCRIQAGLDYLGLCDAAVPDGKSHGGENIVASGFMDLVAQRNGGRLAGCGRGNKPAKTTPVSSSKILKLFGLEKSISSWSV